MSRAHIIPAQSRQAIADAILRVYALCELTDRQISYVSEIRIERIKSLILKLKKIKDDPTSLAFMPRLEILASFVQGMGYNIEVVLRKRK